MTVPLPYAADFGPLVVAEDVNESVLAALRYWLPTHIHHLEVERSLSVQLPRPKGESYATVRREEDWHDHRLPMVICECAGTGTVTQTSANGIIEADWALTITVVGRGPTYPATQKYTSLLEGAVRRAMLQQPNQLLGRVWFRGVDPIRPVVDENDSGRYMCAAVSRWNMAVDNVAQSGAGPVVPSDPYQTPPIDNPDADYGPLLPVTGVILELDTESIGA